MVKKGYRARRKKSSSKNKKESRRCFKCENKDHLVAQCPYNSDNDDDDKKSKKKEKKEKKDKMTIKMKKKDGSYVVTWDSDASSSDVMTVMMTRPLRRRLLQALPFKRSLLSSTLHHAS
jgi:sulfatase maturation enzyme AslB (radical SAM superfamily)